MFLKKLKAQRNTNENVIEITRITTFITICQKRKQQHFNKLIPQTLEF